MKNLNVAVIGFPNAMALDFVGPMDVLATANMLAIQRARPNGAFYQTRLYSLDGEPFRPTNGMQVVPEGSYHDISFDEPTMLVLSGGIGVAAAVSNTEFIEWLKANATRFERIVSICSATFILAQAGLLAGKTVTTHWYFGDMLQTAYPDIEVNDDAIYIQNGHIYTSAGVSTGIDLMLAIVMEDLGRDLAMQAAQQLVLYLHRPGGQRQFSPVMTQQSQQRTSFNDLVIWMAEHLDQPLDIDTLATKACMSSRHFSRKFQQETGLPPMRFLTRMRLETSRTLLEQGKLNIQTVAKQCGFQSTETFRRQFQDVYGLSPKHYQGRF